jgi:LPS export ABC transporter protein LptC
MDSFAGEWRESSLSARKADVFEKENRIDILEPVAQFYEQGQLSSTLQAGRGRMDSQTRDVWAWDSVVIISTDGARLASDWMHYISAKDRIVSTAPVTITRPGSVIHGRGWEATPDLSQVVVHQQEVEISGEESGLLPSRGSDAP